MAGNKEAVLSAKIKLGEAGPVWWDDNEPDLSGEAPENTPYAGWWLALTPQQREAGS